ncbi:alpha/beta hydrolase [Lacibacter luteus]|uniref:Alpha/beta hydrolase n=1 Tax=Lacibacter luteus TaxID=2508719 RepID=A0A4Q1CHE3_9BACT|nr:prolyl oligopeptidase family serine peptidase [Lacibacter luteus]RXK59738.1 alpha/beta hydrolase [Lacibacter luteus]
MTRIFAAVVFFLFFNEVFAQDTIHFTQGLAVASGSRYGREAIYTDLLAWKMYNGTLVKPAANAEFATNEKGDKILWREITADSTGRFRVFGRNFQRTTNPFLNPGSADRGSDYLYLTYNSSKAQPALLNIAGNSAVYINGAPHMGDPYSSGYMYVPVMLKNGLNEFYVRAANVLPLLILNVKPVQILTNDLTLPIVVVNQQNNKLKGALVVANTSSTDLKNLQLKTSINGKETTVEIASIPAVGTRKVIFEFDASGITAKGKYDCKVSLLQNGKVVDEKIMTIEAVDNGSHYSNTFISAIDGSLQYFAVTPQLGGWKNNAALFLSVHGAGVEAIGQARAYKPKDWGTLVAATNRRPRGFNWEDWGRLDALEVLAIAKQTFQPDPAHIYLTGHSMGGHGTWFLGATYADKWAAIAPAAGYASLKDYGSADGRIPDSSRSLSEKILLRSGNQSDVPKLAFNYKPLGVYILHGDSDRVVPVTYARQMRKVLADFHSDYNYYEYPGGEHWFGDQSVDWPHIFSFFKWHSIAHDTAVNTIDFTTSSPGISSSYRWATVYQQQHPLQYSRIQLKRNRTSKTITGSTENVLLLQLALNDFGAEADVKIVLDSTQAVSYKTISTNDTVFVLKENGKWSVAAKPGAHEKNPQRYGTFKEAFNHHMLFVVATGGSREEKEVVMNKAVYDAETWYYRGNGAVDIITDKEYTAEKYKGRNVILYGNANTNSAWKILLNDCPIQVSNNEVKAGDAKWNGNDLAAYFIWPQKDSKLLVGIVAASGVTGMKAAYANQYFAGGSGFPDFMIFNNDMLKGDDKAIKLAGFFDNQWELTSTEYVLQK